MTEIINILKEEAKYDRTVNHDQRTYSECVKKPTMIHSQCDTHPQFESQLKLVHNLNTVKQTTTEILMEETNPVKQTPHKVSNKPWLTTSSNTSYDHHSARPPAREPSTYGIHETPITYQYSVPIANRYTTLSSCQEQQSTSEITSPPRSMTVKNRKYAKRSPKGKKNNNVSPETNKDFPIKQT